MLIFEFLREVTKVSLIKPHDVQFDSMLVNTLWEIIQDGFLRGSEKMIFGFVFSWILWCFAYGTLIINYLASRIMGEHFLLTIYEGSSTFKMVLPHAKDRNRNDKFGNITENFPYLCVAFAYQILKTDKSRRRNNQNIFCFCKRWNIGIACFFSFHLKNTINSKREKSP